MSTDTAAAAEPAALSEGEDAQQRLPLRDAVARRAWVLQKGYREDNPKATAALARLRRGAGKLPADCPELWGLGVDLAECEHSGFTEEQAETAAHVALSLHALHQQSRRGQDMHQGRVRLRTPDGTREGGERVRYVERSLGWAVRDLMPGGGIDESIRRRFVQAATAPGLPVLAYRLRSIVQLLRREGIPLDYGLLAEHLLTFQRSGGMREVRSAWGQGFALYRAPQSDGPSADETTTASENE